MWSCFVLFPLPLFHPTCRKYIERVVKYCERKGNEALVKNLICAGKGVWHYMLACAQAEHVAVIYACKCICLNMSPFPYGLWRFPLSNCVRVVCLRGSSWSVPCNKRFPVWFPPCALGRISMTGPSTSTMWKWTRMMTSAVKTWRKSSTRPARTN